MGNAAEAIAARNYRKITQLPNFSVSLRLCGELAAWHHWVAGAAFMARVR
jgi:hypothetical protein